MMASKTRTRLRTAAAWTVVGLVAFVFLTAGLPKLLGAPTPGGSAEDFARWGYPAWFRAVVGAGETLGALLLLLPRVRVVGASLRFWGAAGLALDMTGALATHLLHGEAMMAPLPLTLLLAVGTIAGRNRPASLRRGAAALKPEARLPAR